MPQYPLDRTTFKALTAKEADALHAGYYKNLTWQERLRIANYLNSIAYNYPVDSPPKLDRTKFRARAHNESSKD